MGGERITRAKVVNATDGLLLRLSDSPTGPVEVLHAPDGEAPFGYCPQCGARGIYRQQLPGGKDGCENGHAYWTAMARREMPIP